MSQQPSDWAMGEASNVIGSAKDFSLDLESGYIRNNTEKYHASTITRIALALDAARKVPEGCVRLPDGRDASVTKDGYVVTKWPAVLWYLIRGEAEDGSFLEGVDTRNLYSTREAAEAARKDGTR